MSHFDEPNEPITSEEYRQLIESLQAKGFDHTPIGEALLGAIRRIEQKVERRELARNEARLN